MEDLWPLFGLRIESGSVVLRLPREHELEELAHVAASGVHRVGERPFLTPWAEGSPNERALSVLRVHWSSLASWTVDCWALGLAIFSGEQPIGVAGLRAIEFPVVREVTSSSWLGLEFQGRGFGTDARVGLLDFAFEALGAEGALTEVFQDNHASQRVSKKLGYRPDGISRDRRGDEAVTSDRLRLERSTWAAHDHGQVTIVGFDPCRATFGL